jgi:hypothetical protein
VFGIYLKGNVPKLNPLWGGAAAVGSQFGRFTQLSASKMVTPRQTIKTKALLRRLVGVGKKLGKTDMTMPSLQVDQFTIPRN